MKGSLSFEHIGKIVDCTRFVEVERRRMSGKLPSLNIHEISSSEITGIPKSFLPEGPVRGIFDVGFLP